MFKYHEIQVLRFILNMKYNTEPYFNAVTIEYKWLRRELSLQHVQRSTSYLHIVADNPQKYSNFFSNKFKEEFLEVLKHQFGKKAVKANIVYQSYIKDRHRVHMNATRWETLADFVKWLGREGLCCVEDTDHGWYITYIDHETNARQEALVRNRKNKALKKKVSALDDMGKIEKAKECASVFTELVRKVGEHKVILNLNFKNKAVKRKAPALDDEDRKRERT